MKTPLFFIAAIAAFFALPFDFTAMASVLFGAGLAAIMVADYRRTYRAVGAASDAGVSVQRQHESLRLAA